MSDDSQIFIPASFIGLFLDPGRIKPRIAQTDLAQRYELCEDLAQMLTETASHMLHSLQITEVDVLQRCLGGLQGPESVIGAEEARWVITRLAELMQWPALDQADPVSPQA